MQTTRPTLQIVFLCLQSFNVAFLLLHDWMPLGRLSNLAAIRKEDSITHRVVVTLLGALPASIGLYFSALYLGHTWPHWLGMYLWITYGIFLAGLLRAWWVPYLLVPDPPRAARYQIIFAGTHKFLPERNGMAPDTLHTVFHMVVLATIVVLYLL